MTVLWGLKMKAILISIKPRFVKDILKGLKSLEIRKTFPQCELPVDVYIYCTQNQGKKNRLSCIKTDLSNGKTVDETQLNGKVVAKFTLNDVRQIYTINYNTFYEYKPVDMTPAHLEERGCVSQLEIDHYLHKKKGYAWCIENLEIIEPMQISDFKVKHYPQFAGLVKNTTHYELQPLTKAPQSWCYIEV